MSEIESTKARAKPARAADDGLQFALEAARLAADHRTAEVVVLDLRGLSGVADFFVIGTGTSERQMRAALEYVAEYARGVGRKPLKRADVGSTTWVLADYVDVVIHLFDEKHRAYYDLEGLWGDAPRVEWRRT